MTEHAPELLSFALTIVGVLLALIASLLGYIWIDAKRQIQVLFKKMDALNQMLATEVRELRDIDSVISAKIAVVEGRLDGLERRFTGRRSVETDDWQAKCI